MRLLIISDIHANLTAFETVLAHAQNQWDFIWCLGDLVGYGPDPNECIELLRQYDHLSLSGNHDWAVLGRLDIYSFNADARAAIFWTQDTLKEENRLYLEELPPMVVREPFTLAHASPRHPVWEYILEPATAEANFDYFDTPYCLVGHTHNPIIFAQDDYGRAAIVPANYSQPVELKGAPRLIINPGSVGQPRDSDPRAAYAILDTEKMTWEHRRIEYPIEKTQERMRHHNLPYRLIVRLEYGW
ncbi:MAG: metallophosphatase family protein [Chloroflexi bacterium]|nr:metallophosphatase family protein [Chloroflexota bacterium]MCI0581176.1 metallophosphatase family protein [Chloroflexota bacterium]MCI0643455.1 metallophosphatase family protein [Chloroflexota bacterium]MCI0727453.1 metallophosphatase family protein [Chloroflexota bacterium]